jgi:hypothetical protein
VRLAESAPLLIAVDDARWAGEPSLRFLAYLFGRLPEQPMAMSPSSPTRSSLGG